MKNKFSLLLFVTAALAVPAVAASGQFRPAPPTAPVRGVIPPLIQLPPGAALDLFASDLRSSLQQGAVPDISLFQQFARVYDQRYHELYSEALTIAQNIYTQMVRNYEAVSHKQGMTRGQLELIHTIHTQTLPHVHKMITDAQKSSQTKSTAEHNRAVATSKRLADQIAQYKGNPATLSMPLSVFPRLEPGAVVSRVASVRPIIEDIALRQLAAAGDRMGSGSPRSNEWLLLLRDYQQGEINRDAALRRVIPSSFDPRSVAP